MGRGHRRTATAVPLINHHFVFCARHRRRMLLGPVVERLKTIIREVAAGEDGRRWELVRQSEAHQAAAARPPNTDEERRKRARASSQAKRAPGFADCGLQMHALGMRRSWPGDHVQLVSEGEPCRKPSPDGSPQHPLGKGTVGLDAGPSTLAAGGGQEAPLAPFCAELVSKRRQTRRLPRKLDRRRRAHNPDHYPFDATVRKGPKTRKASRLSVPAGPCGPFPRGPPPRPSSAAADTGRRRPSTSVGTAARPAARWPGATGAAPFSPPSWNPRRCPVERKSSGPMRAGLPRPGRMGTASGARRSSGCRPKPTGDRAELSLQPPRGSRRLDSRVSGRSPSRRKPGPRSEIVEASALRSGRLHGGHGARRAWERCDGTPRWTPRLKPGEKVRCRPVAVPGASRPVPAAGPGWSVPNAAA